MAKENWIDFKALKAAVTMEAALAHYSVPLRKVNAEYLRGRCPLPSHPESSTSDSFIVNTTKNVWSCKNTGCRQGDSKSQGNVLDFCRFMEQCTVREAGERMMAWNGSVAPRKTEPPALARPEPTAKPKPEAEAEQTASETGFNKPLGFQLKDVAYHPYLEQRGISKELATEFGIGFFPGKSTFLTNHRLVIPIHNEKGELLGYAGRCIDGLSPDKYKLPAGFKKSLELFNLHRVEGRGSVILVEGFFGVMKLWDEGFGVVGLMGSSISDAQIQLLSRFDRVYLMLDGDEAGRTASPEVAVKLARSMFVRIISVPDGKQPDDLTPQELETLLG